MNRFKVYLRSGTVITLEADSVFEYNKWLTFHNGDNSVEEGSYKRVALFAPDMWEGFRVL